MLYNTDFLCTGALDVAPTGDVEPPHDTTAPVSDSQNINPTTSTNGTPPSISV